MTQLILNIDDPSVLPTWKKVVKAFKGVSIDTAATKRRNSLDEALEDVRQGRVYKAESTDDLFKTILGI